VGSFACSLYGFVL
jgi:hypothetical protein